MPGLKLTLAVLLVTEPLSTRSSQAVSAIPVTDDPDTPRMVAAAPLIVPAVNESDVVAIVAQKTTSERAPVVKLALAVPDGPGPPVAEARRELEFPCE